MIYGLPESKNDIIQVYRLPEDDINSVVHVQRLGKTPSASSSFSNQPGSRSVCRPLKVELASNKDRDWVLRNDKMLNNSLQEWSSTYS